jgi:hypothetical protein
MADFEYLENMSKWKIEHLKLLHLRSKTKRMNKSEWSMRNCYGLDLRQ